MSMMCKNAVEILLIIEEWF